MKDPVIDRVPEHLREAVQRALSSVFGRALIDSHQPMAGGASGALALLVRVSGRRCVLRVEARRSRMRNPHQYTCMQIASDAGIAPPLRYADAEAGVAIMDYVAEQPLHQYPGGVATLSRDLAALVEKLHATSLFPAVGDFRQLIRRMLAHVQSGCASGLLDRHVEAFERVVAAYPWNPAAHVSCHNDPNPRNTLFDGNRLWLIDWETSYRNDPFVDVAILAENHAPSAQEAIGLLHAYLRREPQRAQIARLRLVRQLVRLYYGGLMLSAISNPATPMECLAAPTPDEFRAMVAGGKLTPASVEAMIVLGKMCLGAFATELLSPGYEDALSVASEAA
jgi:aminoglycoside phosphotransferase (APT) family kinase protein